jgi:hypothetical protein
MCLSEVLRHKKLLAFILILFSLDIFIISNYILTFTSNEDKINAVTSLATSNSILIAAIGIMYQVNAAKEQIDAARKKDIEFRIQEQRRDYYIEFLSFLAKFLAAINDKGSNVNAMDISSVEGWNNIHYNMMVYASPEVINLYGKIRDAGTNPSSQKPFESLAILALLFRQIRQEVGFEAIDADVSLRRLMSLIMNDVYNEKYDTFFQQLEDQLSQNTR